MFSSLNQAFENAKRISVPSSRASISFVACVEEDKVRLARSQRVLSWRVAVMISQPDPFLCSSVWHPACGHPLIWLSKSSVSPTERRQPSPSPRRCQTRSSRKGSANSATTHVVDHTSLRSATGNTRLEHRWQMLE